jgi:hypothetical protein
MVKHMKKVNITINYYSSPEGQYAVHFCPFSVKHVVTLD